MTRQELEHIVRACATIADDDEIIIIGSQSILGSHPQAPAELTVSNEADVYPKNRPERADLIDGSIGELSPFHDTYGYYAQGVGPTTAIRETRLVSIQNANTRNAIGWCLDVHDLCAAKCVAGRPKDKRFVTAAFRHRLIQRDIMYERVASTALSASLAKVVRDRVDSWSRSS